MGSTDGTGSAARFFWPTGVATDGTSLFVTDFGNNAIRKIVISTGVVTTIAGGTPGVVGSTDGTGSAVLFSGLLSGIATDGASLFVADTNNDTIRKIVISTGVVTTFAGSAGVPGSTDGTGSAARFNSPLSVATDGTNIYVASQDQTIRKIVIATGVVTTVAGSPGVAGSADGTGSAARFNYPYGSTTDGANSYLAESGNNASRKIVISTGVVTTVATMNDPFGIVLVGTTLYTTRPDSNVISRVQ